MFAFYFTKQNLNFVQTFLWGKLLFYSFFGVRCFKCSISRAVKWAHLYIKSFERNTMIKSVCGCGFSKSLKAEFVAYFCLTPRKHFHITLLLRIR